MRVILETARLYLRPLTTPWDLLRFHTLHTDPFVVNAIYNGRPPSFEDTCAEFKQSRADWDTYGIGLFAVFGRDCSNGEGRFLGQSGLSLLPESDDLELSACFHQAASGSEYAPEAGCAILNFAFTTLGAARVLCFVLPDNRRFLRSVGKMGFRQIGERWFGHQLTRCFEVRQQDLDVVIAANPPFGPRPLPCLKGRR
ncbi:GNAT family N-acetyltransferase [Rhizobium leguminosarum]|uniref:GNAT family N-acetyltransferase n=1 Tax=Rhizobium leguminosarum TaxID=384 RepID=UPI001FDF47CB|nr:GNAT family N-acetyltransferase [Rhizobium leguminosarum]